MNEWMKEAERSSLAHTLKGDGKEDILGCKDPKWRKEMMVLGWWMLGYKDPKWIKEMETWVIYE